MREAAREGEAPPVSPLEWLARAGYAARGLVYLAVGGAALLAANELRHAPVGTDEALRGFAAWPLGPLWLGLLAVGLLGFVFWRAAQALLDADRQGTGRKALAHRAGQAISGLIYGGLAFSCLEALDDLEEGLGRSDAEELRRLLDMPAGEQLLIGLGLAVAVAGVLNALHGLFGGFRRHLKCAAEIHAWAIPLARAGYFIRGAVFMALAFFLIEAALDLAPAESATVAGALQTLEAQPFGSLLLGVAGAGLMAFGAFGFVEARWRRIVVPEALTPG